MSIVPKELQCPHGLDKDLDYCKICQGNLAQFMECDSCRNKFGSPTLCVGCRHNRWIINELLEVAKIGKLCHYCYLVGIGYRYNCPDHKGVGR